MLFNNAKKALSEAQERLNSRCEQIKSQVSEVKAQVKSTAKSIVDEAKEKGKSALYRVSEFLEIKKRLLDIRENVRGAIKTTDKDIAKTALLAIGFREAGQTVANAFRTFADKPEVDYSQKEQKHPITKTLLAPMKAVKKMLVSMELHLDASIDKLDNLVMNVQLDKEHIMGHGNKYIIDLYRRKAKEAQEEYVEWYESICNAIADFCESLYKDTDAIISENDDFFSALWDVNQVVCLGMSFGDVDVPYLDRIEYEVRPETKWLVYYHSDEDLKRLKSVFGITGISRKFEVYFRKSDNFWDR